MAKKPVVHYRKSPQNFIEQGERARVVVMDHPCFAPGAFITTKLAKSYDKDTGEFETEYAIYKPEE